MSVLLLVVDDNDDDDDDDDDDDGTDDRAVADMKGREIILVVPDRYPFVRGAVKTSDKGIMRSIVQLEVLIVRMGGDKNNGTIGNVES